MTVDVRFGSEADWYESWLSAKADIVSQRLTDHLVRASL
jgi:hypothetical protein